MQNPYLLYRMMVVKPDGINIRPLPHTYFLQIKAFQLTTSNSGELKV